jgi:diketogulonate reductase-like aldo/keto reductase
MASKGNWNLGRNSALETRAEAGNVADMNPPALTGTFPSSAAGLKAAVKLSHGGPMPWCGLGVWQVRDGEAERVVRTAIDLGYRSIDTAMIYGNERAVGRAIRGCGVPRAELFVTTKAWNDDIRAGRVPAACEESLARLGLDYVDLYLIHWAVRGKIVPAWKAAEGLFRSGRARAIGVSNHMVPHLEELLAIAEVVPAVNQVEFHPYLQSRPLLEKCRAAGIQVEAWSPLMQGGEVLRDPAITRIAQAHGKTAAQVVLRWDVQRGVVTIPKSSQPKRIAENAGIFDFSLSPAEMAAIDALDRNQRRGADPFNFPF